jgi:hypothetical protein
MSCLLSDVPFSVFAMIETFLDNEEEVCCSVVLAETGELHNPAGLG